MAIRRVGIRCALKLNGMKHSILIFMILLPSISVRAQLPNTENESPKDAKNNKCKNELDFSLLPVFGILSFQPATYYNYYYLYPYQYFGTNTSGASLQYKRRLEGKKYVRSDRFTVLRTQLGFSVAAFTKDSFMVSANGSNIVVQLPTSQSFVNASIGLEIQRNLGRFQLIYGADVFGNYSFTDPTPAGSSPSQVTFYHAVAYTNVIGVAPFIGANFFISPRISLGVESAMSIGFAHSISRIDQPFYSNDPDFSVRQEQNKIDFRTRALSSVNLGFHF